MAYGILQVRMSKTALNSPPKRQPLNCRANLLGVTSHFAELSGKTADRAAELAAQVETWKRRIEIIELAFSLSEPLSVDLTKLILY